ncbi:plasmid replication protein (plasmid) [Clostridium perfringens]
MKNYKVTFTEKEKNLLNTIESDKVRHGAMSIYAYLILQSEYGYVHFTFRKFTKKYNRKHTKISPSTLKNRVDLLVLLGLVEVIKAKQFCTYKINRFLDSSKDDEDVENTNSDADCNCPKIASNNIDIDLYSNSPKEFDPNKYKKCTSLIDVRRKATELLKIKKVKSSWIKERVLIKVTQNYRKITVKFLENYILKIIASQRELYYKNYKKYIKSKVMPNFTQREDYNYIILEQQLLGHY